MHGHEHDFEDGQSLRPKGARASEHEAGAAARMAAGGRWDAAGAGGMLDLQRAAGNAAVASTMEEERSPVHDVINGGGKPLDEGVRADMEGRLGADFGDVRVHDDSAAHDSAVAVNAHAYTVGSNVVFQRDRYDPSSDSGKVTLAHELTHVMQQRSGPVEGTATGGGISVSDPGDRFEREASANAERVMSSEAPSVSAGPASDSAAPAVQREEAGEEEEEVQALSADTPLQREEGDEEEEAEV